MLTRLTIRNFKRFDEVEIELGSPVVFIGPNNSGKTSAMQARCSRPAVQRGGGRAATRGDARGDRRNRVRPAESAQALALGRANQGQRRLPGSPLRVVLDKLGLPNLMAKSSCHELVEHVPAGEIDPEIGEKLDAIARVAEGAA